MMIDNNKLKVFNQALRGIVIRSSLCFTLLISPAFVFAQYNFYTPGVFIIPVHTQADELHVSAGVSFGYNLNTSYSISNRLALFASGGLATGTYNGLYLLSGSYNLLSSGYKIKKDNYSVAGGMGYLLNPTTTTGNVFELFIGAGKYKCENYQYTPRSRNAGTETYATYWSVFGQFNAVAKTKKVEIGAALRLAYSKYNDLRYTYMYDSPHRSFNIEEPWAINAEPVLSISYVMKKVKLNAQGGFSCPLIASNSKLIYLDPYTQETREAGGTKVGIGSFIGSINLQYNLSLRKEKD